MNMLTSWLEDRFQEVSPKDFYRGIFPAGELDAVDAFTKGKYTGIMVTVEPSGDGSGKSKIRRQTITDDLEAVDQAVASNEFCLCSPISYAGKRRTAEHARYLYAVAVDLDNLREKNGKPVGLMDMWGGHIEAVKRIPKPTYIVSSGTGLHLYYVLDKAVPMYVEVVEQLQKFKHELTCLIWNEGIVDIRDDREIQQEGIFQGFRMPGTITKNGDRARAFLTGERVTLEYLNSFVSAGARVKLTKRETTLTMEEARAKYPEWYERKVLKQGGGGAWHTSRAVYDWWKKKIFAGARVGHRYYCLMTLAMYARKCSLYDEKKNPNPVTREELEKDCFDLMGIFETLTKSADNHFTKGDVLDALEAFDDRWTHYPRAAIEYRSGIEIPANKRNGRKQALHLERMRAVQKIDYPDGEWRNADGRPKKGEAVKEWRELHPDGRKIDCFRQTGISRPTIDKYWN